jgi:hypothetical protein
MSPGLVSPTYEASHDVHVSGWFTLFSRKSITLLYQLPPVGMGRAVQGENKEHYCLNDLLMCQYIYFPLCGPPLECFSHQPIFFTYITNEYKFLRVLS